MYTNKLRLRFPVSLIDMPTMATSTASIFWIDHNYRNTNNLGFVLNKLPELIKCPLSKSFTLCLSNRLSAVKTFEIFKGYRTASVFGKLNNLFRNYMKNFNSFNERSFTNLTITKGTISHPHV